MKPRLILAALLVATTLAACGKGDTEPALSGVPTTTTSEPETTTTTAEPAVEETELDVAATDYAFAFEGDEPIPAGGLTVNLTNEGAEEHQAAIIRFEEGRSLDDLAAIGEDPSQLDAVVIGEGGPNGVAPGATVSSTQVLEPGEYAFVCFIPSPDDGVPHLAKGMVSPFTVEGEPVNEEASADDRLVLSEYEFGLGDDALLEAGTYVVENDGEQIHEVVLYEPAEGSTTDDVIDFFTSGEPPSGPPPFAPAGGVTPIDPGQTTVTNLGPGEYVFICFLPDAADGAPHFTKGMIQAVTVEPSA